MSRIDNDMNEERTRIVTRDIHFSGLNTLSLHDSFQRMSIAYSIPETIQSEMAEIKKAVNFNEEEKQQILEEILLNETNCHGYFFEQMPSMCYKQLCLEMYDDNLDTYIRTEAIEPDFQWTLLQDLCCQLVDSMTWLHQNNIHYDGRLHPRNIFVKKTVLADRTVLKLRVPDKINPFNNLDEFYSSFWSVMRLDTERHQEETDEQYRIKKDMASLAFLVYFIQSAGYHLFQLFQQRQDGHEHPDWPENRNEKAYTYLMENIEKRNKDVRGLEQICFCVLENPDAECQNQMPCKQRFWMNSLAKDWIECSLHELFDIQEPAYYTISCGSLKRHPFFWKVRDILNFIERSSNYLKESGEKPNALVDSPDPETTLSSLEQNYSNIINYLCEPDPKFQAKASSKPTISAAISRKRIPHFQTLLHQIRNKSSHWNERQSKYKTDAEKELKVVTFIAPPDNEMNVFPIKYCLFWMCNFPTLLLETWNNFKDDVNY